MGVRIQQTLQRLLFLQIRTFHDREFFGERVTDGCKIAAWALVEAPLVSCMSMKTS